MHYQRLKDFLYNLRFYEATHALLVTVYLLAAVGVIAQILYLIKTPPTPLWLNIIWGLSIFGQMFLLRCLGEMGTRWRIYLDAYANGTIKPQYAPRGKGVPVKESISW
ncbi:hypothetical protein LUCX_142 [Xanthomonas phage vB_XciM_LucasX]|nr:hypothetical protein LUCX_142 [Xanthomonas phage vB_XciM_LucasX]